MSSHSRQVTVKGESIEYRVRQSDDATEPRIDVGIHGITVVVPAGMEVDPEKLLLENESWVAAKKQKYDRYRNRAPDREFAEGEVFPYLGESHEIVVESRSYSIIRDGTLRLAEHHVDQTSVKRALETLYRRKAREVLTEHIDQFADEMGVEYNKIELRNQRTRWGSCSTTGTLSFNWRLVMAPSEVLDYVVIHELAHLREPNHTQAFWSLVSKHDPEYEEHIMWLEEHSTQLIFSADDL